MVSGTTLDAPLLKSTTCSTPFYHRVPKSVESNLRYRKHILTEASRSAEVRARLRDACRRDILFFINTFCWTKDPRRAKLGLSPKVPFVTWPYQDEAFVALNDHMGQEDLLQEKSRDMGASWICLTVFFYRWLFRELESFLMVSRKEEYVDGKKDSLFAHLDFLIDGLPVWLLGPDEYKRNKLSLVNHVTGSVIEGESTTENIGRGGRRLAMLLDEFAAFDQGGYPVLSATADNTDCRIFNSTPNGTGNAFYSQRQKGTRRLRFHWSQHPTKGAGLYKPTGRSYKIIDHKFWDQHRHPDGGYRDPGDPSRKYQFRTDIPRGEERVRSPWYDRECDRRAHAVEIATQLDIDYQGSAYPFFAPEMVEELIDQVARPPEWVGELSYSEGDGYQPTLTETDAGHLKLWVPFDDEGRILYRDRNYVVSCDISQGTGASNSVATVTDMLSGTKVGELALNTANPDRFARLAYSLAVLFTGVSGEKAFMIWEQNGPGGPFGKVLTDEIGYLNIYYKTDETGLEVKFSDKPGWFNSRESQRILLHDYRTMLHSRQYLNLSAAALSECTEYIHQPGGKIVHAGAVNTVDPSDTGENHGDRVIADALGAKIFRERGVAEQERPENSPIGSFEWRRRQRELDDREQDDVWVSWE